MENPLKKIQDHQAPSPRNQFGKKSNVCQMCWSKGKKGFIAFHSPLHIEGIWWVTPKLRNAVKSQQLLVVSEFFGVWPLFNKGRPSIFYGSDPKKEPFLCKVLTLFVGKSPYWWGGQINKNTWKRFRSHQKHQETKKFPWKKNRLLKFETNPLSPKKKWWLFIFPILNKKNPTFSCWGWTQPNVIIIQQSVGVFHGQGAGAVLTLR